MNIRRLIILLVTGWFLAASMATAADAPAASGVPRAVFEGTTYHFPSVVEGVVIVHEFKLKNSGTADLKVEKVKTG